MPDLMSKIPFQMRRFGALIKLGNMMTSLIHILLIDNNIDRNNIYIKNINILLNNLSQTKLIN